MSKSKSLKELSAKNVAQQMNTTGDISNLKYLPNEVKIHVIKHLRLKLIPEEILNNEHYFDIILNHKYHNDFGGLLGFSLSYYIWLYKDCFLERFIRKNEIDDFINNEINDIFKEYNINMYKKDILQDIFNKYDNIELHYWIECSLFDKTIFMSIGYDYHNRDLRQYFSKYPLVEKKKFIQYLIS